MNVMSMPLHDQSGIIATNVMSIFPLILVGHEVSTT